LALAILLGTSLAADAFVIAFRIPNLLRRLTAEGAMTGAFVPVFSPYRAERTGEAWEFAERMFWTLASVLAGVTLLGIGFAPAIVRVFTLLSPTPGEWSLAVLLTRMIFPYCVLIALAALASATLNTLGVFGLPASTPIFLNLAIIGAAAVAYVTGYEQATIALAVGVVVGGVLQLGLQLPALWRRGMRFRFGVSFRHPGVRRVARLLVPAFAGVGIYQVNVLVSTIFATSAWVPKGSVAALYYADRVMEVALGVYAISVATVILPLLSQQAVAGELGAMKKTLSFAFRNVGFIVVPAAVGLIVLHGPIIRVLFQHAAFGSESTALTARALIFYAVGLPAFAAVRLVVQAFYALQDTVTPVRMAAAALVANIVFCSVLVVPLQHAGLALATSLASYLNFFSLYWVLRRRVGAVDEPAVGASLARTAAASAGMGVLCWGLNRAVGLMAVESFRTLVLWFGLTLVAALAVYALLAWLLRAEELTEMRALIVRRQERLATSRAGAALSTRSRES
ncbi:MAG: murein biosynthesis integral membrane protein MurJ, partial [Acidobacteria bacterium]|nr:murein biosynthesis integral membrane protein MurJ [Acidobacteriota bacterium]